LAIAGLGFGPPVGNCADFAIFFHSGLCPKEVAFAPLAPPVEPFETILFGGCALPFAITLFPLVLVAGFFGTAGLDSSFFSLNSNAGLGRDRSLKLLCRLARELGSVFMRVISAAGFTPAAAAALAAVAASAGCFGFPSISGFTIT
jgi:hypothetical protein